MSAMVGVVALAGALCVPELRRWLGLDEVRIQATDSLPAKLSAEGKSTEQRWVGGSEASTSTFADTSGGEMTPASTTTKRQVPSQRSSARAPHDEITVNEQSRGLPDVVAAADDALNSLRSQSYFVQGHIRSTQSEPNDQLQGLITTDLILDVKLIDNQDVVLDAFTITSRGGGFTSASSALQARERLRDVLHEHLRKEHP
jgi:hypothetical protein